MRDWKPRLVHELPVYLLVAVLGIVPAMKAGHVVGDGVDMYGTVWFYWWIQHCIATWTDPSWTDFFFYPLGKDIFAHTGNNFVDAVLAAPFIWIFGSPGYQRVFVVVVLLGNALSFRHLARYLFPQHPWAVFAATLAWLLNPYVLFEITCGRLTQAFLPFLPLALLGLLRSEEEFSSWRDWRHPVLLGVMLALQAWTYWFMGWFMAFLFAFVALYGLWKSPRRGKLLLRYAVAALAAGLVVAPAVFAMARLASDGEVPGLAADQAISLFELPPSLGNNVSSNLHGYLLAEFKGAPMLLSWSWLPLLVAFLLFARERWRWVPGFLFVWLMSLGPVWDLGVDEGWVLPWYMAAYHLLPAFERLWFPYRMLSVLFLALCLGVGGLIVRLQDLKKGRWPWVVPALIAVFSVSTALEQHHYRIYPFVTRDLSLPRTFEIIAEEEGAVLHLPFGISQPAIIWQTFHEQKMFGGMGENARLLWPDNFAQRMRNSFVSALLECTRAKGKVNKYSQGQRERFEEEGFRWVVYHRDLGETDVVNWHRGELSESERIQAVVDVTAGLVELLGEPVTVEGPYILWDLRGERGPEPGLEATPELLQSKTWPDHQGTAYEAALREANRLDGAEP
jgi:hypothetical protein